MIDTNDPLRCALTYHGLKVGLDGDIAPCCQYLSSDNVGEYKPVKFTEFDRYQREVQQRIHDDAEAGIRHDRCKVCWREEDLGLKSLRQQSNESYGDQSANTVDKNNKILHVQYLISNVCNLKCIMCSPWCSSLITAERLANQTKFEKLGMMISQRHVEYCETEEFYHFSEDILKNVNTFRMTGGEPFINPSTVRILEDVKNKHLVHLSFNTNFSSLPDPLIAVLKKFKTVFLNVSLEGVGDKNYYIRYPSKWQNILDNFIKLKSNLPSTEIQLHHTIQHTSVYALPELVEFAKSNNFPIHFNTNQGDDWLNLDSVPPRDFNLFVHWAKTADLDDYTKTFIKNVTRNVKFNYRHHVQFRNYIATLDEIRGLNYDEIFKPKGPKRISKFIT
jgi:organic radical activating enzyme